MSYCEECGTELVERFLENEGIIPYCNRCKEYRFPKYNVAVSIITIDDKNRRILLIKQYGRNSYILVAGYVNKGERPEAAVARELMEEVGLTAGEIRYNSSGYFERSNTLMLNFACHIEGDEHYRLTDEVDEARWFSFEEARENIRPGSLAERFLNEWLDKNADI